MHLNYKRIITGIFVLLVFLAGQQDIYAQRQPVITAPPLVGDSIKAGKTIWVQDTAYFDEDLASSIVQTKSISNIVSLSINEFSDKVQPDTFNVEVQMRIHYKVTATDSGSKLDTLKLFYSKDSAYNSKAIKFYKDYHSLRVEIVHVSVTGAPDTTRGYLVLENMMVLERYFAATCAAVTGINLDTSFVHSDGELSVSWEALPSIPLYELEWTYMDQAALDTLLSHGDLNTDSVFRNNATRVQLTANNYRIPLLYDGDGHLFFRVRVIQFAPDNEAIPGAWSSSAGEDGLGDYTYSGHQRKLNWQATTSFAEEGKRKSVVQYYDGSLKARQTVTKDNTSNTTIVAETFYDKQGRPVIQVLPAPTLNTLIAYTPLFNVRGINTAEYDKSVYDTLLADNDYCCTPADSMSSTSGATKYYSPKNPLVDTIIPDFAHQFVPDAHGYPFTETRYTRDNTGRIDRQSGVDSIFRIGSGKETQYFYGAPAQRELDALFGTEAGDASHYEKNMVRDANGQYSVSYVDMHGRTVATALTGLAPASLQQLPSYDSLNQTDNLLTPANNVVQDNAIRSSQSILVPVRGAYTFNYSLSPESLSINDCNDSTICYDCLYDLTITISDNCNNEQFGGHPKIRTISNFSLFRSDSVTHNLDTTCTAAGPVNISFTDTLEEGSYDISKVLSVSRPAMEYYRDSIFIPHNTCQSYDQLVLEMLDSIRQRIDCTPDSAITILTTAWREQMMANLTPNTGQYADTSARSDWFSIFDKDRPDRYLYQSMTGFKDEDGNPDVVIGYNTATNTIETLLPQQLSPGEFIADFRDSWAEALLPLHPEYRLLLEYEKLKSAYTWEADFFSTQTFADALAKGYLNPTGTLSSPASNFTAGSRVDSLFLALNVSDPSIVASAKQSINDSLFQFIKRNNAPQYYNLWGVATGIIKCDSPDSSCYKHWNEDANVFNTDSLCTADLDQAWRIFRAQYLHFRGDWIDKYTRLRSGIYPEQIHDSCIAVFPDANFTTATAGQTYGNYNGTTDDAETAADNLDAFLHANCEAYAQKWWQDLAPCGYSAEDSAVIIPKLIQVAYEGADKDHPFGSSTVKPGSTNIDKSFEQVIHDYNVANHIDTLACTAYLIPNPKPYDQPGVIINYPIITAPDSCSCSRITTLYNQFIIDSSRYHSFGNYMQVAQGTTIREGILDTLRSLCSVAGNCKYLEEPILLPPAFQCNTGNVCTNCTEVKAYYDSFHTKYGVTPVYDDTNTVQSAINYMFQNYMNAHLGFSKTHVEYLDFLQTCEVADTIPCHDSTNWIVYNPGADLVVTTDLYDSSSNNMAPVNTFFYDDLFHSPGAAQASHYVLVNKKDSVDASGHDVLMQWRVKPSSDSVMINPFAKRGTSNFYLGAQWSRDPSDTTWWIGKTFMKQSEGDFIKGIGFSSNDSLLRADWVKITDTLTGDTLYLDEFALHSGGCGPFLCGKQAEDSTIILSMQPCADTSFNAQVAAGFLFDIYRKKLKGEFEKAYSKKCLDAGKLESFTVRHPVVEYHYTLYYYDQAGNLVKTVPPEGVDLKRGSLWLDTVNNYRALAQEKVPEHRLATTYRYNSLNQVISQHSPDGGLSTFWYDRLGRLVVSQNAKQAGSPPPGEPEGASYSYTLYDQLGRITEVGQKKDTLLMTDAIARNQTTLKSWLNYSYTFDGSTVIAEQVTQTVYDVRNPSDEALPVDHYVLNRSFQKSYTLRNRVSYTRYYDILKWNGSAAVVSDFDNSSTYSYDIHGNVDTLLHYYHTGLMSDHHGYNVFKSIAYKYDLISGKVNEVHYQPGMADQFYHRYEYDAENRLTDVYTTDRKELLSIPALEEHDARYSYYKHGPLARTVLGQQQVQGLDYAYTLQGWLKGVNSDSLIDRDGMNGSIVAKDVYRFSLNYFDGEYHAIGTAVTGSVFAGHSAYLPTNHYRPLYNGNISSMVVGIPALGQTRLYNYGYDQLNRIVSMDAYTGYNAASHVWGTLDSAGGEYKERVSYDANGNIKTYLRNGYAGKLGMDSLTYGYNKVGPDIINNKLRHVKDPTHSNNYTEDIDSQVDDNYVYDAIGNLVKDSSEHITSIEWTVYGKIRKINKPATNTTISYTYDVAGNRISKTVTVSDVTTTTWYVRDAQGNPVAIYTGGADGKLLLTEHHLYGSSRLGILNRNIDMDADYDFHSYIFARGYKFFELSNHLGNVMAMIGDRKFSYCPDAGEQVYCGNDHLGQPQLCDCSSSAFARYYKADVVTANDYYPFGMVMPGRKYSAASGYRYGFNGKENDNDINSITVYDYGFRIYNPGLGRFLSIDPLTKNYPSWSPYPFSMNRPIDCIDLDGLESLKYFFPWINFKVPGQQNTYADDVIEGFSERAIGTLIGLGDLLTGNVKLGLDYEKIGKMLVGPKLSTIGDYKGYLDDYKYTWRIGANLFEGIITDYAHLIKKTFKGDGKAAGALLLEAFLFYLPEGKLAEGAGAARINETALKQAVKAVAEGEGRSFVEESPVIMDAVTSSKEVGAMRRMEYEAAPYHGKLGNKIKSKGPVNGQDALDMSIQVKETSSRRVGIDYATNEFVVFDKTLNNVYHGHVRGWKELHKDMQNALIEAGMTDKKGNIITHP